MKSKHPNSEHPVIAKINAHVYRLFKPKKSRGGFLYGKLYYYADSLPFRMLDVRAARLFPQWMLDGITPVGPDCVLGILKARGVDISEFEQFFAAEADADRVFAARREELRRSAAAKLTDEECEACALSPSSALRPQSSAFR